MQKDQTVDYVDFVVSEVEKNGAEIMVRQIPADELPDFAILMQLEYSNGGG